MKKILILFLSALVLLSCETDLDQSSPLQPSFSEATPEALVIASYAYLKAAMNYHFYFGDIRSDDAYAASGEEPHTLFDQFNADLIRATDEMLEPYWKGLIVSITHNNNAINNSEDGTSINGEAKFLRAFANFTLVQAFGGVPIFTASEVSPLDIEAVERNTADEVYAFVIEDLQAAIASLPETNTDGRPSTYAAQALLAKVYMAQGNTVAAEPLLENVINNSGASLLTEFADIFSNDNELNSEIIFAFQYSSSELNADKLGDLDLDLTNLFTTALSGSDSKILYPVTDDLTNAYSDSDVRSAATFNGTGIVKYLPEDLDGTNNNSDYIVIRLADVILLYAEAVNENASLTIAETVALLDNIRVRAGLSALTAASFNTRAQVEEAIKEERRLELAFEGQRWFDLVRWGDAQDTLDFTDDNYLLFPLPLREVNANGGATEQNPGY